MATQEQIDLVISKWDCRIPQKITKHVDESTMGIGAVLRILAQSDEIMTAGMISEKLLISTARVAVLLKKLEAKGLVEKAKSPDDGRITIVKLTEKGYNTVLQMQQGMYQQIGRVIDSIGLEKSLDFIETAKIIGNVMVPPEIDLN